jgi:hypothetical protein
MPQVYSTVLCCAVRHIRTKTPQVGQAGRLLHACTYSTHNTYLNRQVSGYLGTYVLMSFHGQSHRGTVRVRVCGEWLPM